MTTSQSPQPPVSSGSTAPAPEPPFLSLHTTVVLLVSLLIGIVVGVLTVLTQAPVAAAVLAGLTAWGASIPIVRSLIR